MTVRLLPTALSTPTAISSLPQQIGAYYHQQAKKMRPARQFHWHSRRWLWLGERDAHSFLQQYRPAYVGNTMEQTRRLLAQALAAHQYPRPTNYRWYHRRATAFAAYPQLLSYNYLMFRALFAETIYSQDIRPAVYSIIPRTQLLAYVEPLLDDPARVALLSTHAVNYLYLAQYFSVEKPLNPAFFLRAAATLAPTTTSSALHLQLYLLTHCIIGESRYYHHPVGHHQEIYQRMLALVEAQLTTNYPHCSLDSKFEFLVCAELCQYPTTLREQIIAEAAASLSPEGDYVVDTHNDCAMPHDHFERAEHRNILLLMATAPFRASLPRC